MKCWLLYLLFPALVQAADLGTWGELYPVQEPDMLTTISQRLQAMQDSGELAEHQAAFRQRVTEKTLRPEPVAGMARATKSSTHFVDPTFIVSHDLADHQGNIFARQGQRINPLDSLPFTQTLYFIDADDDWQVNWLKRQKPDGYQQKIILVRGDVRDSALLFATRIYFDQDGLLCERFQLSGTPARVRAEGNRLRVETFAPEGAS